MYVCYNVVVNTYHVRCMRTKSERRILCRGHACMYGEAHGDLGTAMEKGETGCTGRISHHTSAQMYIHKRDKRPQLHSSKSAIRRGLIGEARAPKRPQLLLFGWGLLGPRD